MFACFNKSLQLFSSFLAKHKEIKAISRPLCSVRMVAQHLMNCNPLNYQYSKVVITTFDNPYELMRIVIIQIFQQVQISPRTTKKITSSYQWVIFSCSVCSQERMNAGTDSLIISIITRQQQADWQLFHLPVAATVQTMKGRTSWNNPGPYTASLHLSASSQL